MIFKNTEDKIAELKEYEYPAWQDKDCPAALMLKGAGIQLFPLPNQNKCKTKIGKPPPNTKNKKERTRLSPTLRNQNTRLGKGN